jgi:hypothetical protein
MVLWRLRCLLAFPCLLLPALALAEPVAVNRGAGQGYLFTHRNNCYIMLPNHVSERAAGLTLSAGAPPVSGEAAIFRRYPDIDLALAHVTLGLEGRCGMPFNRLPARIDDILPQSGILTLVYVGYEGAILRDEVDLVEALHDTLVVRTRAGANIDYRQGVSGSVLMAGEVPVAIMLRALDLATAEALRVDAIVERARRLLDGTLAVPVAEEAGGDADPNSLSYRIVSCEPEPFDPDAACARLMQDGRYVEMPPGRVVAIELELEGAMDVAVSLREIEVVAPAAADGYTIPRSLRIEVDSSVGDARRWRTFASGDMPPSGRYRAELSAGQFARRLRILVLDSWDATLPLRIESVALR